MECIGRAANGEGVNLKIILELSGAIFFFCIKYCCDCFEQKFVAARGMLVATFSCD